MITIRQGQMNTLAALVRRTFEYNLSIFLQSKYRSRLGGLTEEQVQALTSMGISRAEEIGLDEQSDIAAFVTLALVVGWHFDAYPPFQKIFQDQRFNISVPEKLRAICASPLTAWPNAARFSESFVSGDSLQDAAATIVRAGRTPSANQ